MLNNTEINLYLSKIKAAKHIDLGRCSNMVWLIFANKNDVKYSLHIQCPCRFVESSIIILSSNDIYCPSPDFSGNSDFDWDVQGNNLFDYKAKKLLKKEIFTVAECSVNAFSDLVICFENGTSLMTFCANSGEDEEQWRIFSKGSGRAHLVAYPFGSVLE